MLWQLSYAMAAAMLWQQQLSYAIAATAMLWQQLSYGSSEQNDDPMSCAACMRK